MGTNENDCQTWDDARKSALVAQIVSGKLSVKAACELHALSPETIQDWVRVFRRTTLQALDDHLRQTFLIQGADAASLGSAEYTGTLADIPLSDLIQTFQMGARDGVIAITCDGRRSRLWCRAGEIIDAESGRLQGEPAAYRILALDRGQVFADFRGEARERSIDVPANLLLLEAARQKDESGRVLERLGGLQSIYKAVLAPARDASAVERALLGACDGRHDLSAVLEQSEQGDLETLNTVSSLVERGALVRESAAAVPVALVISKETPSTIVSVDILRSVVSLAPIAASQRPAPRPRRHAPLMIAFGAALALGGLGWGILRARSTGRSPAVVSVSEPAAPPVPAARAPQTFELDTVAEPAHAELWLDGLKAGVGRLRRELLQDGQSHSLRVVAEGHAPTTLLFKDAPPPSHIRLEPLAAPAPVSPRPEPRRLVAEPARALAEPARPVAEPARTPIESGAETAPRAAPAEPVRAVAVEPPRAKRPSVVPPRAPERPRPAERAATPPSDGGSPSAPRVQIIEPATPVVRIIE